MLSRLTFAVFLAGALRAVDFSGSWALAVDKSNFGGANPPQSLKMVVSQKPGNLAVESTLTDARGTSASKYTLDLSGKEAENTMRGSKVVSVSEWRGPTLHVKARTTIQDVEIKTVDQWQLDEGGRVLTIYRTAATPKGEIEQKFVYEKSLENR